jgi:4-diphosphocytidyl-2-C-methyl-D-erythritol kinase
MIAFPNCKINLGLNITSKRADGYHDLETIFFPVGLHDILEIVAAPHDNCNLNVTGISAGKTEDNLCIKAYRLLKKDHPQLPGINMHLHKSIPPGAGLGGGSADASFTLSLLNKKFNCGVSTWQLQVYALQLGSDCPFFIINTPCHAIGRGEILEPVSLPLSGYTVVLVNPGIRINTRETFRHIRPIVPEKMIKEIIRQPVETWRDNLVNDFEPIVFKEYPQVADIKKELYNSGAVYASMSGSGSTMYGLFQKGKAIQYTPPVAYFHTIYDIP